MYTVHCTFIDSKPELADTITSMTSRKYWVSRWRVKRDCQQYPYKYIDTISIYYLYFMYYLQHVIALQMILVF